MAARDTKRPRGEKGPKPPKKRKRQAEADAKEALPGPLESPGEGIPAGEPEVPAVVAEAPEVEDIPEDDGTIALDVPESFAEPEEDALEGEDAGEDGDEKGRLRRGMFRSRKALSRPFVKAATKKAIDPEFWEDAEDALIAADTGVACASAVVDGARKIILAEGIRDVEGMRDAFRREVAATIESFGAPPPAPATRPHVIFVVGVNGVGKTTTTAKIGYQYKRGGRKVLFAAADTFRAAGIEQMEMWAHRVGAPVVRHKTGGDHAEVVFDAVESAKAKDMDVVLVDTAGRLHTKKNLMEELAKMWRVAERQLESGPQAILVIDATTGQNGVVQARVFSEALEIGSIALTKMDGSAKGGVVMAIGRELGIPVAYIGVGEGLSDLRPFDPEEYARALYG